MHGTEDPSEWVTRWTHLLPPQSQVLDLACGAGRHMRWLAAQGHQCTGVDRSPDALAAAQAYGQEMGSQEYQNAFNRYQAERQARLGPLQSLAGVGQTTAQQLGASGAANAGAVGNYLTGGAAAQAAGQVGGANAVTGGLGTYLNYTQGNNLLSALRGGGGGSIGYGSGYAGGGPTGYNP